MDEFEGLDEEQLQQLMALGIIPEQQGALAQQMKIANGLRDTEGSQMRTAGRVSVAANPMEEIGSVLKQYAGTRDLKALQQKQEGLMQQQAKSREDFMKAYFQKRGQPVAPTGPAQQPQGGPYGMRF